MLIRFDVKLLLRRRGRLHGPVRLSWVWWTLVLFTFVHIWTSVSGVRKCSPQSCSGTAAGSLIGGEVQIFRYPWYGVRSTFSRIINRQVLTSSDWGVERQQYVEVWRYSCCEWSIRSSPPRATYAEYVLSDLYPSYYHISSPSPHAFRNDVIGGCSLIINDLWKARSGVSVGLHMLQRRASRT